MSKNFVNRLLLILPKKWIHQRVINSWAQLLQNMPNGLVHDESYLPFPKSLILRRLILEFVITTDTDYRQQVSCAAAYLARFQQISGRKTSIGEQLFGLDLENASQADLVSKMVHDKSLDDLEKFMTRWIEEEKQINELFAKLP